MAEDKERKAGGCAHPSLVPSAEGDDSPARPFPLRYLGLALFVSWLCLTHISSIYPGNPEFDAEAFLFDVGMRIGDVGTLVVFVVMAPRIKALSEHMRAAGAACALTGAGTLFIAMCAFPLHMHAAVIVPASIVTAIGGAFLFCLWAQVFSRMNTVQLLVYAAGCCIGAFAVSFLVGNLRQPVSIFVMSLLPIGSFICAWLSLMGLSPERPAAQDVRYPLPTRLIALMTIAALISSISGLQEQPGSGGSLYRISATCIVGLMLLACTMLARGIDFRKFAHITFPIAMAAVLLIPLTTIPPFDFLASFLGKLAYVCFSIFTLMILATICHRYEVPSLHPFACARACSEGAILLGVLSKHVLRDAQLHVDQTFLYVIAAICMVLLVACLFIWSREKAVNEDWGACGISLETGARVVGERARYERRCQELARAYRLTDREAEVFALLGQKKSRAEIEAALFLSENTVKTHTRHIYQKTGAHSREEIAALIG